MVVTFSDLETNDIKGFNVNPYAGNVLKFIAEHPEVCMQLTSSALAAYGLEKPKGHNIAETAMCIAYLLDAQANTWLGIESANEDE